ncbi:unnamed protein product [Anisakis simplex]|uniref:Uncharacterized protein n=1 Tax=Anisakis simplex TaxID=6269 RepID=A0A0M3JUD6_ANISI|nr:unnamed protein product [Anisakis simplex]
MIRNVCISTLQSDRILYSMIISADDTPQELRHQDALMRMSNVVNSSDSTSSLVTAAASSSEESRTQSSSTTSSTSATSSPSPSPSASTFTQAIAHQSNSSYGEQQQQSDYCICMLNVSEQCMTSIGAIVRSANAQLWRNHRTSSEYLTGADIYTIVILSLFASIIGLLLIRAIKPNETLDDQVTILLNSMRVRIEIEDNFRQKRKLKEAKEKAQKWLQEAKHRSVKNLTFRKAHSTSESETMRATNADCQQTGANRAPAECSLRTPQDRSMHTAAHQSLQTRLYPYARAASHLGFVPEIIVTPEIAIQRPTAITPVASPVTSSLCSSRRLSRCDHVH